MQRPCKTVKYLAQNGWDTDVITIKDIVYHSSDNSLMDECSHKRIFRTSSLDPLFVLNKLKSLFCFNPSRMYFSSAKSGKNLIKSLFPIDEKAGWIPLAYRAGKQALLTKRYHAIMVTCGPFSASITAYLTAKKAKLPLILDYRDHWTLNNIAKQPSGLLYKALRKTEKHLLNYASLVLTATNTMKEDLISHFGNHLSPKIMPYYNGWDEADFTEKKQYRISANDIRISYLGTLYCDRTITSFLQALKLLQEKEVNDFEFQLVGNFSAEIFEDISNSGIQDKVAVISQKQHAQAIEIMQDSDILLLIIGDERYKWVLTGKLFEYLRCQKPILALVPQTGEAAAILRYCGHTAICDIGNPNEIMQNLLSLFKIVKSREYKFAIPAEYERSNQVRQLAIRMSEL